MTTPEGGATGAPAAAGTGAALLRPTRWEDIEALAALERQLFGPDAWSAATWWSELAARPRRAYASLVEPAGRLLGYGGLDLRPEAADVMTVAVAPRARGRGHGDVLLGWLVEEATRAGCSRLLLEVRDDNAPARVLYGRWGFEVLGRRPGYYGRGVDALVMRRRLTDPGSQREHQEHQEHRA